MRNGEKKKLDLVVLPLVRFFKIYGFSRFMMFYFYVILVVLKFGAIFHTISNLSLQVTHTTQGLHVEALKLRSEKYKVILSHFSS